MFRSSPQRWTDNWHSLDLAINNLNLDNLSILNGDDLIVNTSNKAFFSQSCWSRMKGSAVKLCTVAQPCFLECTANYAFEMCGKLCRWWMLRKACRLLSIKALPPSPLNLNQPTSSHSGPPAPQWDNSDLIIAFIHPPKAVIANSDDLSPIMMTFMASPLTYHLMTRSLGALWALTSRWWWVFWGECGETVQSYHQC